MPWKVSICQEPKRLKSAVRVWEPLGLREPPLIVRAMTSGRTLRSARVFNLAQGDLRLVNRQQKIAGTFRSDAGATSFGHIRRYLSTMQLPRTCSARRARCSFCREVIEESLPQKSSFPFSVR